MRHLRIAASVLALAGCDRVFGLDPITPNVDAASDGGLSKTVTGRAFQRYATNDATFQPVVIERVLAPGTIAMSATLDDGTLAPVDYHPDGTFEFHLSSPGQRYRFVMTVGGNTSEIQTATPQLTVANLIAGRPDARANGPAYLQFGFPSPIGNQTGAFVMTTGQWSQSYTGQVGPIVTWPWMAAQPIGGVPLGLLDASANDRAYVIQFETDYSAPGGGPLYEAINAASAASISEEAGVTSGLPAPSPTAFNTCVNFATRNATEYARLTAALLPRTYQPYSDWLVSWVPDGDQLSTIGSLTIAAASALGSPLDLVVAPSMYVPYPGGQLILQAGAYAIFNVVAPGATKAAQLYTGTRRTQKAAPGAPGTCAGSSLVDLTGTLGLAGTPRLDGTTLDVENQTIAIDHAHPATVTWSIVAPGPVQLSSTTLFELVAINGDTVLVPVHGTAVVDQTAQLDSALLVTGHTYILLVTTTIGQPDAAAGDFTHFVYPLENMQVWSQPFVVASP